MAFSKNLLSRWTIFSGLIYLLAGQLCGGPPPADSVHPDLKKQTQRLIQEIQEHGQAYANLKELTALGHRLSGSRGNEKAVHWAEDKMKSYGFDQVWLQPATVPHWERGDKEQAEILLAGGHVPLRITALGTSPGTGRSGITAEVIEVHSLREVERLGKAVKGKLVFYNRPMDPSLKNTFTAYERAVDQRVLGPALAARYGAVGAIVRSLTTLLDDDHPHTGITLFASAGPSAVPAIPAAALSTHAANQLSRALKKTPDLKVKLVLSARTLPDARSYNVIGEIRGRQAPENKEIVMVSGHLDSWDLATGAHDDGAGVVQALEVLRAFKALHLRPRRTVRVVLFAAEEFGMFGAKEYAKQALLRHEKHFANVETDAGGFAPQGFDVSEQQSNVIGQIQSWRTYLRPLKADELKAGPVESEAAALEEHGMLAFWLIPDSTHYFDVHHSALDRLEAVNKSELLNGAAALAVFTYLLAEEGIPGR